MKLNVAGSKATGSAVAGSQQFSMAMNAKAFHTLSSTLYKDKYGAIIREICSNAYDAHTMAGTPERPFVLTFPDRIDSELVIRDFGPGISPEDIGNVYCRFFESTKDNDNNAVGAFGVGSKTPFAYTDTFTVTSIHEGVKRIYTAFKDEGMPNLKLMAETETDEESGLEVCIPVQGKDIQSFHNAVRRELRFFPVKPKSNVEWNWLEWETSMDFGAVQFFKTADEVLVGFFVQIGPVGYRIDKGMITEYAQNKGIRLSPMTKHLLEMSVERTHYYGRSSEQHSAMLDMPIGTVEVQPSREGLHYTDETCQNILDAITAAEKKVAKEMVQRLDDAYAKGCKTFFQMVNELPDFLRGTLSTIKDFEAKYAPFRISDGGSLGVKWDTKIIGGGDVNDPSTIIGRIAPTACRRWSSVGKTEKTSTNHLAHTDTGYHGKKKTSYSGRDLFMVDRVYVKDEAFAYKSRIREHDDGDISYFIEPAAGQSVDDLVAYFEQYLDLVRVSELDKNVNRASTSTTGGRVRSWFELGDWLSKHYVRDFHRGSTLYALRVDSVFNEKLNDIAEPTVVLRTHNNAPAYDCDDVHEKLSLAAMLMDAGYKVIAIPKSATYQNDNLCELDALTDDHHKALRDLLDGVRHTQALKVGLDFATKFNESVQQMFNRNWLTGKQDDYTFDVEALEKALEAAPKLNGYRSDSDMEIAKNVSGADDIQIRYKDMDELFELVNDQAGTTVVPSKALEKIEDDVSIRAVLTEYVDGNLWAVRSIEIPYSCGIVEQSFEITSKPWMLALVD